MPALLRPECSRLASCLGFVVIEAGSSAASRSCYLSNSGQAACRSAGRRGLKVVPRSMEVGGHTITLALSKGNTAAWAMQKFLKQLTNNWHWSWLEVSCLPFP